MIPTRETIDSFATDHAFHDKLVAWLRSMHSEIDILRAEVATLGEFNAAALSEQSNLRADLDRANTEAALARDALAKHAEKAEAELQYHRDARQLHDPIIYHLEGGKVARGVRVGFAPDGDGKLVVDLTSLDGPSVVGVPEWFDAGYVATFGGLVPETASQGKNPGQWEYGVPKIDALAKATTSAPEREAEIEAWVEGALAHQDDDGSFPMWKYEIDNGVAMMRSADGKELLRELRAWICDEWAPHVKHGDIRRILDGIDEMLAQPAPVEIWPEEMKRQTLVGKFEPAPVTVTVRVGEETLADVVFVDGHSESYVVLPEPVRMEPDPVVMALQKLRQKLIDAGYYNMTSTRAIRMIDEMIKEEVLK